MASDVRKLFGSRGKARLGSAIESSRRHSQQVYGRPLRDHTPYVYRRSNPYRSRFQQVYRRTLPLCRFHFQQVYPRTLP